MLAVFSCSVVLALFLISAANDAFAFEKSGGDVTITLKEDANAAELSAVLKKAGVIKHRAVFCIYSVLRGRNDFKCGEFTVSGSMSYEEIFFASSGGYRREQIRITIPEGLSTVEIINIFVSAGIGTRDGFLSALGDDYGYEYIPTDKAERTFRYDGYLYPDTYFFYSDASERDVISKLIATFDAKFDDDMRKSAAAHGLTIDECVTLASIIQKEAFYTAEMSGISSVFHNRLRSTSLRRLESDATVKYANDILSFDGEYLTVDSRYNTYKYAGLPPGAICSPGIFALEAAASPGKTGYYYFFSKSDKTFVFSKTYGEHISNLKKYGVRSERSK